MLTLYTTSYMILNYMTVQVIFKFLEVKLVGGGY